MLSALASSGTGWLNIRTHTLPDYARWMIETQSDTAITFLPAKAMRFVIEKLLMDARLSESNPMRLAGAAISRTIRDLRDSNTTPDTFRQFGSSTFRKTVADLYEDYIAYLHEHQILDEAGIFGAATALLESGNTVPTASMLIILDEVELTAASLAFVRLLQARALSYFRIGGEGTDGRIPSHVAKNLLRDWPIPRDDGQSAPVVSSRDGPVEPSATRNTEVVEAVGSDNEIRAVFRRIVRDGMRFDNAELAYTAHQPYLSVVRTLASRYGIPITLAAGVPALSTRVGQAIRQFVVWISSGCSSRQLSEMIKAGYVRLNHPTLTDEALICEVTGALERIRIRQGPEAYKIALRASGTQEVGHGKSGAPSASRRRDPYSDEREIDVFGVLAPLLELSRVPNSLSMTDLVDRIEQYVSEYVISDVRSERADVRSGTSGSYPADVSDVHQEDGEGAALTDIDEIVADPVVAEDLITRIRQLGKLVPQALPLSMNVRTLLQLLSEAFVCARAASPGRLHVTPLSSAGYTGRNRLFVVGLDELTMARAISEDPLLDDSDRMVLTETSGDRLNLSTDYARLHSWLFDRAYERTNGDVTLLFSNYDVAEDRELYPSSVILGILRQLDLPLQGGDAQSWIPDPRNAQEYTPLDLTDMYLSARSVPNAVSSCSEHFHWIGRGLDAEESRKSAEWTEYDGFVGRESESLNPFRGRRGLSASRLETLTACPFRYFVRHVLRVEERQQLGEEQWLSPTERGILVHEVLARFMADRQKAEEKVCDAHVSILETMFLSELDGYAEIREAPNPAVEAAERLWLSKTARVYISDELLRQRNSRPLAFEFGFGGLPRSSEMSNRPSEVTLDLDGLQFPLRGSVDRVDRLDVGGLAVTDYKTGSSRSFNTKELLNKGATLQWALYAYAVEAILGEPVVDSGYLFLGSRDMGLRLDADPSLVREEIAHVLKSSERLTGAGLFLQAANDKGTCLYCDFRKVCGDIPDRVGELRVKLEATDPENELFQLLDGWRYANGKLGTDA